MFLETIMDKSSRSSLSAVHGWVRYSLHCGSYQLRYTFPKSVTWTKNVERKTEMLAKYGSVHLIVNLELTIWSVPYSHLVDPNTATLFVQL